jgi:hypothetical protein
MGDGDEVAPPFEYKQMVFSTNSFFAADGNVSDTLVEREANQIAFSRQMTDALDFLWRRLAIARKSILLVCKEGRRDSVFVALLAMCHCYHIPPCGSPRVRQVGGRSAGLATEEVDAAVEYVCRVHSGAVVSRVMRSALVKIFVLRGGVAR